MYNLSSIEVNGGPGASLKMWKDFIPSARIIGVDIEREVLFKEDRIVTYYCDQLKKISIENFVKDAELAENSADIIIDDGMHNFKAGKSFLEVMIKFLNEDGIYIIEDIDGINMNYYKNYFSSLTTKY